MPAKTSQLVISAIGHDRPGIVDYLTKHLVEHDLSVSDSRMTVLGGEFAMQMLVEGAWNQLSKLEKELPSIASELDLSINSKWTDIRKQTENRLPYAVEVVALDNPGIVNSIAGFLSQRNINIEDMQTSCYPAAHTGAPMFAVEIKIAIPADMQISSVRDDFMEYCDSLNLDAVMEPVAH